MTQGHSVKLAEDPKLGDLLSFAPKKEGQR